MKKTQAIQIVTNLEQKLSIINEKFLQLQQMFRTQFDAQEKQNQKEIEQIRTEHQEKLKSVQDEFLKQQQEIAQENERTLEKFQIDSKMKFQKQVRDRK